MEKAARTGDHEALSNIIEDANMENVDSTISSRYNDESGTSNVSQKLISRKDLNRALLVAVQNCQGTNKVDRVIDCINVLI